ncbi:hypothetical protein TrLO_g13150 [Triparma laevis f. longispina]|uniref:Uncharacterized protein n=1 Tax=Triparma laevis f. longispina TaxID=1714387 RepID=A0A9W7CIH4_9STRA|nr:hypothetical protein TrLO_g13150 [Triparma laevis f. longispina]
MVSQYATWTRLESIRTHVQATKFGKSERKEAPPSSPPTKQKSSIITAPPSPSPPAPPAHENRTVERSQKYLADVKTKFGNQPTIYNAFLCLMTNYKAQTIEVPELISCISKRFHGHDDLILGFNVFLPAGSEIKPGVDATHGDKYLNLVKQRLANEPSIYNEFLRQMANFKGKRIAIPELVSNVSKLFHGHDDLILGFNVFLPAGSKIKPNVVTMTPASLATTSPVQMQGLGRDMTLRRGEWALEEEQYVEKIIICFTKGTLDAPSGVTLRSYLSEKLNCDPMRISKKLQKGATTIGRRPYPHQYTPINSNNLSEAEVRMDRIELKMLEMKWKTVDRPSTSISSLLSVGTNVHQPVVVPVPQEIFGERERAYNETLKNEGIGRYVRHDEIEIFTSDFPAELVWTVLAKQDQTTTVTYSFLHESRIVTHLATPFFPKTSFTTVPSTSPRRWQLVVLKSTGEAPALCGNCGEHGHTQLKRTNMHPATRHSQKGQANRSRKDRIGVLTRGDNTSSRGEKRKHTKSSRLLTDDEEESSTTKRDNGDNGGSVCRVNNVTMTHGKKFTTSTLLSVGMNVRHQNHGEGVITSLPTNSKFKSSEFNGKEINFRISELISIEGGESFHDKSTLANETEQENPTKRQKQSNPVTPLSEQAGSEIEKLKAEIEKQRLLIEEKDEAIGRKNDVIQKLIAVVEGMD